jgi:hypothetical protein
MISLAIFIVSTIIVIWAGYYVLALVLVIIMGICRLIGEILLLPFRILRFLLPALIAPLELLIKPLLAWTAAARQATRQAEEAEAERIRNKAQAQEYQARWEKEEAKRQEEEREKWNSFGPDFCRACGVTYTGNEHEAWERFAAGKGPMPEEARARYRAHEVTCTRS